MVALHVACSLLGFPKLHARAADTAGPSCELPQRICGCVMCAAAAICEGARVWRGHLLGSRITVIAASPSWAAEGPGYVMLLDCLPAARAMRRCAPNGCPHLHTNNWQCAASIKGKRTRLAGTQTPHKLRANFEFSRNESSQLVQFVTSELCALHRGQRVQHSSPHFATGVASSTKPSHTAARLLGYLASQRASLLDC